MLSNALPMMKKLVNVDVVVSDFEILNERPSYTSDTLHALCNVNERNLFLLGEDAFLSFHRWKDYISILSLVDLVIGQRTGSLENLVLPDALKPFRSQYTYLSNSRIDVSSTSIRNRLLVKESVKDLIPSYISLIG